MKSRIICLCFCLVALAVTVTMTARLINSGDLNSPVIKPSVDKVPESDVQSPASPPKVELNEASVKAFATQLEDYIVSLAYGDEKAVDEIEYYKENIERVSEYLLSGKVGDKSGADYYKEIYNAFNTIASDVKSDKDFSERVSTMLIRLDNSASQLDFSSDLYPALNTDIGGTFTLAMLSAYEELTNFDDGSTITITVGGSALLGDKLGNDEALKFSTQLKNHYHNYPLYAISPVTCNDDLTFIALEAPLTNAIDSDSTNPVKGSPEYAKRLLGVDAVSLASGALMEYGENGLNDTASALRGEGISYSVQQGSQSINDNFGKVVYITFDLTDTPVTDEQNERSVEVIKNAVSAERMNGADLVIVLLHWNTRQRKSDTLSSDYLGDTVSQYEEHFDAYNKEIARGAIGDGTSGADLVVGYGSRVPQGIESYNGKMIVYETGDLSYVGEEDESYPNSKTGFLFRQTFVKTAGGVKSQSYRIMPIINTSDDALYLPTLVFDERADAIIDNLVYQSRYFGNAITDFNYIRIKK